jgi:glutamate/tyrosine decarboxylase-like PLP-dependent enzyme
VTLPYLARLGVRVAPWGLSVPGVSSVSVDLHKYGYTAKGASVIVWRDRALRRWQTYATDDWLGGRYGSSGVLGTKSGGPIAAAWAVMHHLGDDGYLRLAREAREVTQRLCAAVATMPELRDLRVMAEPDATLLALEAAPDSALDPWALAEELWRRGWWVDRQGPPPSIHLTVNAIHGRVLEEFLGDLCAAVGAVRAVGRAGAAGAYGTVE